MENSLLYYISLALFGTGILLSNAANMLEEIDLFSIIMVIAGIGLIVASLKPVVAKDYKNEGSKGKLTYLLLIGAVMMIAGAILRIAALI